MMNTSKLQNTSLSLENKDASSEIKPTWKHSKTKGFMFVKTEEKGEWKITYLNEVCTPLTFSKLWKAEKYINEKPWELITVTGMINANYLIKQSKKKRKEVKNEVELE